MRLVGDIRSEVRRIITEQYERDQSLLDTNRTALEFPAGELLEKESVDGGEVRRALRISEPGIKVS
jgi:ATP-dependent Zn protease